MAAPLAEELERLLNPLPRAQPDPEDDPEDATTTAGQPGALQPVGRGSSATAARVIEKFDEGVLEEGILSVGHIRKGASVHLLEADKRYHGKATSRKALEAELWGEEEEEEAGLTDEESPVEEMTDEEDLDSESLEENLDDKNPEGEEEEEIETPAGLDSNQDQAREPSKKQKTQAFTFQAIDDFEKFAERMDEMGSTDEEDGDENSDSEEDWEDETGSEENTQEPEEGKMDVNESKDDEALLTFSKEKVAEEVEKGKAVKNQIALWDQLLEGRIKLQKVLLTANQLPQPDTFLEFKKRGGPEFAEALKNNYKALKALLRTLVDLQDELLQQYSGTRHLVEGRRIGDESDQEIPSESGGEGEGEARKKAGRRPPKRKLEMEDYPEFASKRFAEFRGYRNSTLQKWHDKTKLASGKLGKGFGAFERSILTQIDHILMDKERLLRRAHTKRSAYRVLGRLQPTPELLPEALPGQTEALPSSTSNAHLKDLDEEIFDDDDFYHQLLRELIERKTSSLDPNDQVAMGRQWLAIQKLRSKIRKKVDTKASKGRKIRYHVHSKLVSFMMPVDHCTMNDDARTELYRSLFGKQTVTEGACS